MKSGNIMREITLSEVRILLELYKAKLPQSALAYNFLLNAGSWLEKGRSDYVQIYVPDDKEQKDYGTFIAFITINCYQIFMYTLDPAWNHLKNILHQTDLIPWHTQNIGLFALDSRLVSTVHEVVEKFNAKVTLKVPNHCFVLLTEIRPEDIALSRPNYTFGPLDGKAHCEQINDVWPHRSPGSVDYVKNTIDINYGFGVFEDGTKLIAWIVKNSIGILGLLQVDDAYKRQSLGSALVKKLSSALHEEGYVPTATVVCGNDASRSMFEKLGFIEVDRVTYTYTTPC